MKKIVFCIILFLPILLLGQSGMVKDDYQFPEYLKELGIDKFVLPFHTSSSNSSLKSANSSTEVLDSILVYWGYPDDIELTFKLNYIYNKDKLLSKEQVFFWHYSRSNKYIYLDEYQYKYNLEGLISERYKIHWDSMYDEVRSNYYLLVPEYNIMNQEIKGAYFYWENNSWSPSAIRHYNYNFSGLNDQIVMLCLGYETSLFDSCEKIIKSYNIQGLETVRTKYHYYNPTITASASEEWRNTYTNFRELETSTKYSWSYQDSAFMPVEKQEYLYNQNNYCEHVIYYEMDKESDSWKRHLDVYYERDETGKLLMFISTEDSVHFNKGFYFYSEFNPNIDICSTNINHIQVTSCDSLISPSRKWVWYESGIYNDTIRTDKGCDSILSINLTIESCIDTTLGLEDASTGIKLYPNPISGGLLNIQLDQTINTCQLRILDLRGCVMLQRKYSNTAEMQVELNALKGLYLLEIVTDQRIIKKPIIVQ